MNTYPGAPGTKRPIRTLTDDEQTKFFAAMKLAGPDWYVAAHLMGTLGLRVGEVRKLNWRNVRLTDAEASEIDLTPDVAKARAARKLPLPTWLALILHTHKARALENYDVQQTKAGLVVTFAGFADEPVITKRNHTRPGIRYLQIVVGKVAQASIGHRINCHMLRHTFATNLLKNTNTRVVQTALGHRSLQSTQIYTHPSMADLREAVTKTSPEP